MIIWWRAKERRYIESESIIEQYRKILVNINAGVFHIENEKQQQFPVAPVKHANSINGAYIYIYKDSYTNVYTNNRWNPFAQAGVQPIVKYKNMKRKKKFRHTKHLHSELYNIHIINVLCCVCAAACVFRLNDAQAHVTCLWIWKHVIYAYTCMQLERIVWK